eukprot:m.71454 g.71454  ORF g.71454 m.71454 type:complete len:825 (-) comp16082_c0_seq11:633-3107(-)
MYAVVVAFVVFRLAVGASAAHSRDQGELQGLRLALDHDSGSYTVAVDGNTWFTSGDSRIHVNNKWCALSDKTLSIQGPPSSDSGTNNMGKYNVTSLHTKCGETEIDFNFYQFGTTTLIFETVYVNEATGTSIGDADATISEFPTFDVGSAKDISAEVAPPKRGFYQWSGSGVPGYPVVGPHGQWPADASTLKGGRSNTGVIAVFDATNFYPPNTDRTVVLSPASSFLMTSSNYIRKNTSSPFTQNQNGSVPTESLVFGIQGRATSVPAKYSTSTILHLGTGINSAMREWGALLLARSGKPTDRYKSDFSLSQLGYTTDNGAYYYYNTVDGNCHNNFNVCKGYQPTILSLKEYVDKIRVPIRWILYDSWFYSKENTTGKAYSALNSVINWTDAAPEIFPAGLDYMFQQTDWPVVAHNRAWSVENVYSTANGGNYEFLDGVDDKGTKLALPVHQTFWDFLFMHNKNWGLINYQQDWMFTQQGMEQMLENVTLARTWTLQMSEALVRNGLNFGFGGSTTKNWLQSTEMYAVTNGRISMDYHAGLTEDNWRIGLASIFAWSIAVIPAKDGYWTTPEQPGNPYDDNRTEPYGHLHGAVATLSRGPVSPADKIGLFNRDTIMRSCMDDGTLLQPDFPATAIDREIKQIALGEGGPLGEVWSTSTTVSGWVFGHVLAADLQQEYVVSTVDLSFQGNASSMVLIDNANVTTDDFPNIVIVDLDDMGYTARACGKLDFQLLHTSPVFSNGWVVLGEYKKFVPISASRTKGITTTHSDVRVVLRGAPGETVSYAFVRIVEDENGPWSPVVVTCTLDESGSATVTASGTSGQCEH